MFPMIILLAMLKLMCSYIYSQPSAKLQAVLPTGQTRPLISTILIYLASRGQCCTHHADFHSHLHPHPLPFLSQSHHHRRHCASWPPSCAFLDCNTEHVNTQTKLTRSFTSSLHRSRGCLWSCWYSVFLVHASLFHASLAIPLARLVPSAGLQGMGLAVVV